MRYEYDYDCEFPVIVDLVDYTSSPERVLYFIIMEGIMTLDFEVTVCL